MKLQEDPNASYIVVRNLFDGQGLCRFIWLQKNSKAVKIPFKPSFMLELKPLHNIVYYSFEISPINLQTHLHDSNNFRKKEERVLMSVWQVLTFLLNISNNLFKGTKVEKMKHRYDHLSFYHSFVCIYQFSHHLSISHLVLLKTGTRWSSSKLYIILLFIN